MGYLIRNKKSMKTQGILLAVFAASALFTLHAEEKDLVANHNVNPHFAPPAKIMGKTIWNNVDTKSQYAKELSEIAKEPMTQSSFVPGIPYLGTSLFESEPPANTRLVVREIELVNAAGKNIAPAGKLTASAEKAELRYADRVKDGDSDSKSYTAPPKIRMDQPGVFMFQYSAPQTVSKLVLKSGMPRNFEGKEFVQVASDFSLEVQKGNKWEQIVKIENNAEADRTVPFSAVSGKAFRLKIERQSCILKVSVKKFIDLQIPADRPFHLGCNASRLPYNCFENYTVDKTGYEEWKKAHPNFIGFYIGEWGWDFCGFARNQHQLDSYLKKYGASPYIINKAKKMLSNIRNREDAMKAFRSYYDAIRKHYFGDGDGLFFIDCSRALSHYAMDWGCRNYAIETTASGYHRHQVQMYFVRGAAHQFGKPWGWYIAVGMNGDIGYSDPDYIGKWSCSKAGGNGGISPSLNLRDRFLAWFGGASFVMNEVWPYAYCMPDKKGGPWKLSPHGEAMKSWFDFTQKYPDRGVPYAPVALGLQYDHFVCPINGGKIFSYLPQERCDLMTEGLLRTVVPYKFCLSGQEWSLSETPYGDIFDVILPSTPKGPVSMNVLKNYRVLFLSGTFDPDRKFAARLMEYVKNGGTLVINVKQLSTALPASFTGISRTGRTFPVQNPVRNAEGKDVFSTQRTYDYEKIGLQGASPILTDASGACMASVHSYGKGKVIVTAPDMLIQRDTGNPRQDTWCKWDRSMRFPFMEYLMARISDEVLPLKVSGKVGYGVNIVKDGLLVYLYNNEGVKKTASTAQTLDASKTCRVTIDLKNLKVVGAKELRAEKDLAVKAGKISVDIGPGDVAVVRLTIPGGVK